MFKPYTQTFINRVQVQGSGTKVMKNVMKKISGQIRNNYCTSRKLIIISMVFVSFVPQLDFIFFRFIIIIMCVKNSG